MGLAREGNAGSWVDCEAAIEGPLALISGGGNFGIAAARADRPTFVVQDVSGDPSGPCGAVRYHGLISLFGDRSA